MFSVTRMVLLLVAASTLFASSVQAAAIASIASGDWDDANIWSSGTVPGTGDTVTITSGDTVVAPADGTSTTATSISIVGTLEGRPNATWDLAIPTITVASGGSIVGVDADWECTDGPSGGTVTWISVLSGGTLNWTRGYIGMDDAQADDVNTDELILAAAGSDVTIQGTWLNSGTVLQVSSAQTAPKLDINPSTPPGTATHIVVTGSLFNGAKFKIDSYDSATNTLTLKDGAVAMKAISAAADDSVTVAVGSDTMQEFKGAALVFGEDSSDDWDQGSAIINLSKNTDSSELAFYVDRTLTSGQTGATNVLATDGIYPGLKFRYAHMAILQGTDVQMPATATHSSVEGSSIEFNGSFDLDLVSFENIAEGNKTGALITASTSDDQDIDDCLFLDAYAGYIFYAGEGSTDSGRTYSWFRNYFHGNRLNYDDESDGHAFQIDDEDEEDTYTLNGWGFRYLTDDAIYLHRLAAATVEGSWMTQDAGVCSFVDTGKAGATTPTVIKSATVLNNRVWGSGDVTMKCGDVDAATGDTRDDGWVDWDSDNNWVSQPTSFLGKDANNNDAQAQAAFLVYQVNSFSSDGDSVLWSPGTGWNVRTDGTESTTPDSVYIRHGYAYRNGYKNSDETHVNYGSVIGGGVAFDNTAGLDFHVVIESMNMKDMFYIDNGDDFSGMKGYVGGRCDNTSGCTVSVRFSSFDGTNSATGQDIPGISPGDDDAAWRINGNRFENLWSAVYQSYATSDIAFWNNLVSKMTSRYFEAAADGGGGVVKFNTFYADDSTSNKQFIDVGAPTDIVGNLFLRDGTTTTAAIRFRAASDTTTGVSQDWNLFAIPTANAVMMVSTPIAWATWQASGGSGQDVNSINATTEDDWNKYIMDNTSFTLRVGTWEFGGSAVSPDGVDWITWLSGNPKDPDGSDLDVGWMPRITGAGMRAGI